MSKRLKKLSQIYIFGVNSHVDSVNMVNSVGAERSHQSSIPTKYPSSYQVHINTIKQNTISRHFDGHNTMIIKFLSRENIYPNLYISHHDQISQFSHSLIFSCHPDTFG